MKYIIMAAGVGTRISREINHIPKCTLKLSNNLSLIEFSIETLLSRNVKPENIAVVVGYSKDSVIELIEKYGVKIFHNPFFKVTNSIASIWFARDFIDGDFIALNADLYYETVLLDELLSVDEYFVMLCDSTRILEADYRFFWKDDYLLDFGKELPIEKTTGEYVGIAKVMGDGVLLFKENLTRMIDQGRYDSWWEDVIYSLISENKTVNVRDIKGNFWGEVDYIEDYERIISYVSNEQSNSI